jgi:formylglycine-generating enzyme required for sulfatase activity
MDAVAESSIALSWRAPGGNNMQGMAREYDLRYASFPFDEDNWNEATRASIVTPSSPGSLERDTLEALTPGTIYFLAIRSSDNASNWSPISSVVNVTLPTGPDHPILWAGGMLPAEGTTATGFVYRVRLRLDDAEVPDELPEIVIDDTVYRMRRVSGADATSAHYESSVLLDPGEYDYYFTFTDESGNSARHPGGTTWSGPSVTDVVWSIPDFVEVTPDTFLMGNPDPGSPQEERPQHEVILTRPFHMDRYEITNMQLCEAFNWARARGAVEVADDTLAFAVSSGMPLLLSAPRLEGVLNGISFCQETGFTPLPNREDWPATYVTWYGAALFCNVRSSQEGLLPAYDVETWQCGSRDDPYIAEGWRLPTEAEWEFVAQYPDGRIYPFGNDDPRSGVDGNFDWAVGRPSPIGSYPSGSNALGIRDLAGNVWEWCNDWKGLYEAGIQTDPAGGSATSNPYRVVRGGSWGSPSEQLPRVFRFSQRPATGRDGLGFRCVRTIQ